MTTQPAAASTPASPRSRWSAALLAAAATALAAANPALAQDGLGVASALTEGATFDHSFSTDLLITQTAVQGGGSILLPDQELEYDADIRFIVGSIGADGLRQVQAVVLSYEAEWESGVGLVEDDDADGGDDTDSDDQGESDEVEFEYDLEPLRGDIAEVFPDASQMTDADRAMIALARATIVLQVNPAGEVVGVRGLSAFNTVVGASPELDDRIIGFFTDLQFLELTSPVFSVDGAAEAPRSPGDTWTVDKSIDFSNIAAIDYVYSFEIAGPRGDEIVIEGEADITMRLPTTPNPIRPGLTLGEASETVRTVFDADRGLVSARAAEHSVTMSFSAAAGEESVVIEQTTSGERTAELIED